MTAQPDMPWWMKVLGWVQSVAGASAKQAAIRRDAKLRKFKSEMTWTDGQMFVRILFHRVYAESEQQARELMNAKAASEHPVVTSAFFGESVPPFIKDPTAALALWQVTEEPLTAAEIDLAKVGELGPAHAEAPPSTVSEAKNARSSG